MSLTDEQKKLRMTGIGGSEIGAVAGLNPHASPLDVFLKKRGIVEDTEATEAMELGNELEQAVLRRAAAREKFLLVAERPTTMVDARNPIVMATPDGLGFPSGGVVDRVCEAKVTSQRPDEGAWGPDGSDAVPETYLCQVAWEMRAANVEIGILAALFLRPKGGPELRVYRFQRDRELEAGLIETANRFWTDHVLTGNPPALDGGDSTRAWLRAKYPTNLSRIRGTSAEEDMWVESYRSARSSRQRWEEEEERWKARLCAAIGEADGLEGSWGRATWRQAKPSIKTDWQALACELADKLGVDIKTMTQFDRTVAGSRRFLSHFSEEE